MKYYKLLCFILGFIYFQVSVAQTADVVDGCSPLTVKFTAPASSSTYFWDFKDQATSNLQSPSNTFLSPGSYNVEFRESPSGPVVGTITIDVFSKPVPIFSSNTTKGCAPLSVNFTNTTTVSPSVTINSYSWVFGDGGTAQGSNSSHTFPQRGNYSVSLELNTNFPSCNVTKQYDDFISVSNPPSVGFITNPDPPVACTGPLNLTLTNVSSSLDGPLSYSWNLDNGQTSTATNPPPQTYTVEQSYTIELTATDTNNCSNSVIKIASVGSPKASVQIKDTVCLNGIDTLFNSSPGASSWNFGPNVTILSFFQGRHPVITFPVPGNQSISLRLIAGGCSSDTTFNFFVQEVVADFAATPTYSCSYPAVINFTSSSINASTFSWIFGDSSTSKLENPSVTYQNSGELEFSINIPRYDTTMLTIMSTSGCVDSIKKIDTIHRPNALMIPNISRGCLPLSVTFSDSSTSDSKDSIVQWEWFYGDGNSTTVADSSAQTHVYSTMGEYKAYLVVTNSKGCTDTSYQTTILVGDQILPDFTIDNTDICIGDTVNFTDITNDPLKDSIDVWHYTAEAQSMFHCFDNSNPSWSYKNEVGLQDISMTVGFNGCFSTIQKPNLINVKGAAAKIYYINKCTSPLLVDFVDSSQNATSWEWQLGDGTISTSQNVTHTYAASGDYQVILKAENIASGCTPTYDTTVIRIRNLNAAFISDTLICKDVATTLNSALSTDVYESCYKGYRWLFSDPLMRPRTGASSTEIFQFKTPGDTKIELIVTDINGCKDTTENTVRVFGITSQFTMDDDTICNPTTVNFANSSFGDTTVVSWEWNFGDSVSSNVESPSHVYSSFTPDREVTLIVTDTLGCKDTSTQNLFMYIPTTEITVSDDSICSGTEVNFSATDYTIRGSSLTFDWNFQNGNTSTQQNPDNTFVNEGKYLVQLNIQEISSSCRNTETQIISVKDFPKAGYFSSGDTLSLICPNENILFTDTTVSSFSPLDYMWNFGNGRTSEFQSPGTVYTDNGIYTIELITTIPEPYGCADTNIRTIEVRGPKGNFVTDLNGDTICRLEFVNFQLIDTADVDQYQWDFGDGSSLLNTSPVSHQYTFVPPSGKTIAKLILSNSDGSCPITQDTIIDIYEVVADFQRNNGIDTAICFAPYPLTNLSLNADQWSWDFGDGSTSTSEIPGIINYQQAGIYNVSLSIKNQSLGCTDTIVKEVILHPIPEIETLGDTICEGDVASIKVTNPNTNWNYLWIPEPQAPIGDSSAPITTTEPIITTSYYATVTDTNACFKNDTTSVFVVNPLNLTDFDTTIVVGDYIDLPVNVNAGLYNFTWTEEEGLSCIDCSPPRIQPLEDVFYNLVLSDVLGCFSYDINFNIKVHPETFIKLPTTFTPNGDGNNDFIYVEGWGIKELMEYQVFNRWGELLFETNDISVGWDGNYKGVAQNNDVYVYKVRVTTWRDEEKALEGYINLVR